MFENPTAYRLLALWYICIMLVQFAYTSNLRAVILKPNPGPLMNNDEDVGKLASVAYMPTYESIVEAFSNRTL